MGGAIGHQRFVTLLKERFPEVAAQIHADDEDLLHLEMATLGRATQAAIDAVDEATVKRHFLFIDEVFREASPEVENAVYVSYLENLRFEGRKEGLVGVRLLLTTRLQKALIELEEHLARIHGGEGAPDPMSDR